MSRSDKPRATEKRVKARDLSSRLDQLLKSGVKRGLLSKAERTFAIERLNGNPRPQRADRAAREKDIIAAAIRIFATRGYHGATLQHIADELGLTGPAFYYYFKNKQQILEAICLRAADVTDVVVDEEVAKPILNYTEALRRTLSAYAAHVAGQDTTVIMLRNFDEMSPRTQRVIADRRRRREAKIFALVERGVAAGEFVTPEPKIVLRSALEMIHALHHWFDQKGRLSRQAVGNVLVDFILDGLLPR